MTYIGSLSGAYPASGSSASGVNQLTYTPGSGLSGLASGINTDAMVDAMVQAAQVPLVQLLQQRQILQWQEMRYQQVNAALQSLQNTVQSLKLQSTFMAHSVTSSNSSVVTGSASTLAPNGSYNITVQQLAQGATVYSSASLSIDPNYANTPLNQMGYPDDVTLHINSQTFTFQGTDTLQTVLSAISSNPATGVSAFYDPNSGKVVLQTTATGSAAKILVDSNTETFFSALKISAAPSIQSMLDLSSGLSADAVIEINGQKVQLNSGDTLLVIESKINNYSQSTGVYASDDGAGHLILYAYDPNNPQTSTYLLSPISVSDPTNALGFNLNGANPSLPLGVQTVYPANSSQAATVAQDAVFTVNGFATTSPTNSAQYNGLTLNLQSVTSSPVTLTVSTDVDSIVNTITNFVQQYNQTLQLMQALYNEQRHYDYQPLTVQQASQMTQDQIEKWYQQAESGVLANDPLLGSIMDTLENDMQLQLQNQTPSNLNGQQVTFNTLASIGITPIDPLTGVSSGAIAPGVTTTGWNTYGLLQINTDQLRAAIQADPQAVMRLFTNNPNLPSNQSNMSTGIAVQLYNDLESQIQQLTQEAGLNPNINSEIITKLSSGASTGIAGMLPYTPIDPNADFNQLFGMDALDVSFFGQQISGIDTQAEDMQQQIDDLRQRYQNEFAQMEQVIAQLSTQSSFLLSAFGSNSSSGG